MTLPYVEIWTDGSNSLKAPGKPGGWAAIIIFGNKEKIIQGAMFQCTNNMAELLGCIDGLKSLKTRCKVNIFTDSEYVQKGWTYWLPNWLKHNWTNSLGEDVSNRVLWQELIHECSKHDVTFNHVKGHSGIENNERVDKLAKAARLSLK